MIEYFRKFTAYRLPATRETILCHGRRAGFLRRPAHEGPLREKLSRRFPGRRDFSAHFRPNDTPVAPVRIVIYQVRSGSNIPVSAIDHLNLDTSNYVRPRCPRYLGGKRGSTRLAKRRASTGMVGRAKVGKKGRKTEGRKEGKRKMKAEVPSCGEIRSSR